MVHTLHNWTVFFSCLKREKVRVCCWVTVENTCLRCCMDGLLRTPLVSLHTLAEDSSNHIQRGDTHDWDSGYNQTAVLGIGSGFLSCPRSPRVSQVLQQTLHYYALWYRGLNLYMSVQLFYSFFFFLTTVHRQCTSILASVALHTNVRVILDHYPPVLLRGFMQQRWGGPCSLYIWLCSQSVNCIYFKHKSAPQFDTSPDILSIFFFLPFLSLLFLLMRLFTVL